MSHVCFCNWNRVGGGFDSCHIFELPESHNYDLIFFDPLGFAVDNQFIPGPKEYWVKRFVSLDEADLLTYIAAAKRTAQRLGSFLENGGALIIRSAAPNLDIRVRKESTVARSKYTTSLLSPYFWLEEILGKFALVYGTRNTIRFLDKHNPIYSEFQDAPIDHAPSIQMISTVDVRAIADNGVSASQPTIFEIVNTGNRGSVFVIPRFNIPSEHLKLITAFRLLSEQSSQRKIKPTWITPFDERLAKSDPVVERISEIDDRMSELKQEREKLLIQQADNDQFTKLLYGCGEELIATIVKLFQRFGFDTREPSPLVERAEFDLYFSDTLRTHIAGSVVSSRDDPVPVSVIDTLAEKIADSRFPEAPKGIIVANAHYHTDPESRGPAFSDQFLEQNREHGFCLLETTTLFEMGCQLLRAAARNGENALQQALRRDILYCDGLFSITEKHYSGRAESSR